MDDLPPGAVFQPKRATLALDARGLEGPTVDLACGTWEGNPAGDVDAWELGTATPTPEQVRALAELTHVPVPFFYLPLEPDEEQGFMWVCGRTGPKGMGRQVCQQVSRAIVAPAAEHHGPVQGALF